MIYYVSPTCDQLDWDEDGPVDRNLFVWATDASEAIKLWRAYYEENRPAAIRKSGERAGSYLVAEVFGARSIILLKDVDGLYTADPKTQAETMSLKQSHNPKVRPFGLHAGLVRLVCRATWSPSIVARSAITPSGIRTESC
jgi:hypothetical protein